MPSANSIPNSQIVGDYVPIFTSDLEHQWKGLAFPGGSYRIKLKQDHVAHKYSEKDGAEVEMVGMDVAEFECRIPFLNSVIPGLQETWIAGQQYPKNLKAFIAKFADKSSGPLQHPFFGTITCKLVELDVEWAATTQDGTWVTAKWISTLDASNDLTAILLQVSPMSKAIGASQELDTLIASMSPALPQTPTYTPNFADTMRSIQGVFDTATQLSARVAGTINSVNYRVNAIAAAINNASNSYVALTNSTETGSATAGTLTFGVQPTPLSKPNQKIQSVMNVRARIAIDQLRVALAQLKLLAGSSGKPVGLFVSGAPDTLDGLTMEIARRGGVAQPSMADLMSLNGPAIVARPVLPTGTVVRYYLPKAPPTPFSAPPRQAA
jgi:hypothetical protein